MLRTPEGYFLARERAQGGEEKKWHQAAWLKWWVKYWNSFTGEEGGGGVMQADLAPFLFMGLHRAVFTLVGIEAGSSIFRRRK